MDNDESSELGTYAEYFAMAKPRVLEQKPRTQDGDGALWDLKAPLDRFARGSQHQPPPQHQQQHPEHHQEHPHPGPPPPRRGGRHPPPPHAYYGNRGDDADDMYTPPPRTEFEGREEAAALDCPKDDKEKKEGEAMDLASNAHDDLYPLPASVVTSTQYLQKLDEFYDKHKKADGDLVPIAKKDAAVFSVETRRKHQHRQQQQVMYGAVRLLAPYSCPACQAP
jgi:hypothetical protein